MLKYLTLIHFVFSLTLGDSEHVGQLLCRKCGKLITTSSEIINVTADAEKTKYNYVFPLIGKNTTVHVFDNPAGQRFHVATARHAFFKLAGERSSDYSWFPGTDWTTSMCKCGQHLGWFFQPFQAEIQRTVKKGDEPFAGLVLENLISADYADSLIKNAIGV
ncbi:unnamed protein product [Auanema sp. JU1783]|nr:unnamed protein product [Auanema sp. JU1783]